MSALANMDPVQDLLDSAAEKGFELRRGNDIVLVEHREEREVLTLVRQLEHELQLLRTDSN